MWINPFDRLIKKSRPERVLVAWNRGLGDVPLGLYALVKRVRRFCPDAHIAFLTRSDLKEVFQMLPNVEVIVDPSWKRGEPLVVDPSLADHFDLVLEKVDPTRHFKWQLKKLIPKLNWKDEWDRLADKFDLDKEKKYIGCHVSTETGHFYKYEKNWPETQWKELFTKLKRPVILFGAKKIGEFPGAIDLRGETTLFEMLSIIKNKCSHLLAPDSGVLSVLYYVDAEFPLKVVSLWADAKQGILRQGVNSPNLGLTHIPLIGKKEDISKITTKQVVEALEA
ncbi:MAG: hypothetical protein SP1CHLAM54_13550 [Chlamydiia bacterium]|nr:hypothetical protein [Chlamydiia bacterium]MCH9616248.1 hypothetical protein [Chlamydiia bacterium]MCH9629766.1 hypothetical protein [Chlamydiia bacterium]